MPKEPFFSIIFDETTDITRSEQVSFCLRFCNSKMESEEVFLGFQKTSRIDAETLFNLVKSSLMSFGLSLSRFRGQAYDGASNMAGRHNGLQAKVLAENRVVQKLLQIVHPIHTMCQGWRVTTGDVRQWVNTTTLSLSADANMINANLLYDAMKKVTLETLHLDMPALPRAKRARACVSTAAITDKHIKAFYVDLYISVMETGSRVLTQRYSKQDLEVVDMVRCTLEEEHMAHEDSTRLVGFYDGDVHHDNLRFERNVWFERCRQ